LVIRWVLSMGVALWHPLGHASNVRVLHRISTVRKQRPLFRDTRGSLKISCCSSDMVAGEAAIHGTGLPVVSLLRGTSFRIAINRKCKVQVSQTSVIQVRLQTQSRKGVSEALGHPSAFPCCSIFNAPRPCSANIRSSSNRGIPLSLVGLRPSLHV